MPQGLHPRLHSAKGKANPDQCCSTGKSSLPAQESLVRSPDAITKKSSDIGPNCFHNTSDIAPWNERRRQLPIIRTVADIGIDRAEANRVNFYQHLDAGDGRRLNISVLNHIRVPVWRINAAFMFTYVLRSFEDWFGTVGICELSMTG